MLGRALCLVLCALLCVALPWQAMDGSDDEALKRVVNKQVFNFLDRSVRARLPGSVAGLCPPGLACACRDWPVSARAVLRPG